VQVAAEVAVHGKPRATQIGSRVKARLAALAAVAAALASLSVCSPAIADDKPATPKPLPIPNADAQTQAEMKPYTEVISGTNVTFDMVPIRGGRFLQGSPETEESRRPDEGPQHEVEVEPFWMGKYEVTWDAYDIWSFELDIKRRQVTGALPNELDKFADAAARPTKPYTDMSFGMGREGYPAICMTQLAAKRYCEWLSAKTGRYYRLPTEAEWEYACRAGTQTAYYFGDDPEKLGDYEWFFQNSNDKYHKVGQKKPNPWGLYDMHGNVAEWVLDGYEPEGYKQFVGSVAKNPLVLPRSMYPRCVRGGSWDDDPEACRSAARRGSTAEWKQQDPQLPQSIWYFTDAQFLGFRVVRPLRPPTDEDRVKFGPDKHEIE
jgi:formylglycine-generating enzyme required for sulfatase activity